MKKTSLLKLVILSSYCFGLNASEVDIPNSFSAGTPAVADEVNQNFDEVEAAVDDNHQKIVNLQAEIEALETENTRLQDDIETLQNAQPSTVATPVSPRGQGTNFTDYELDGSNRGVFTIRFNVKLDPATFVADSNVQVTGAGGVGTGSISWTDNNTTLRYTMAQEFTTISPCFSGGLTFSILGTGPLAAQDSNGKPIDGDWDGRAGGDYFIVFDIVC